MKEFINKLIERLEEQPYEKDGGELFLNGNMEDCLPLRKVKEIVNQLAEEYDQTIDVAELVEKFGQKKVRSNADHIRAMSDEDLAAFLCKVKADYQWMESEFPSEDASGDWEEWLQSEVEE